jgi:hypothetical protein
MEEMLIEVKSARAHTQLINFDPQLLKEYCLLQRSSLSPFSPPPSCASTQLPISPLSLLSRYLSACLTLPLPHLRLTVT